jgi:hypothetical protein
VEPVLVNFVFCDAVLPILEGKFICYGIFSEMSTPKFPVSVPHFCILTTWTKDGGFHIQRIKLLNSSRSLMLHQSPETYFTLNDPSETAYIITEVNQVVFSEPGSYCFQTFLDNRLIGEYTLTMRLKS